MLQDMGSGGEAEMRQTVVLSVLFSRFLFVCFFYTYKMFRFSMIFFGSVIVFLVVLVLGCFENCL